MDPIYNRIHLGLEISPELPWQNVSVAKPLFWGPIFDPKKVPGPKCRPGDPKSIPGSKNLSLGMKKQKMRAEKPCRIQHLELQTEPYSTSYGQKPFWRVTSKSWYMRQEGKSCFQEGKSCFQGPGLAKWRSERKMLFSYCKNQYIWKKWVFRLHETSVTSTSTAYLQYLVTHAAQPAPPGTLH